MKLALSDTPMTGFLAMRPISYACTSNGPLCYCFADAFATDMRRAIVILLQGVPHHLVSGVCAMGRLCISKYIGRWCLHRLITLIKSVFIDLVLLSSHRVCVGSEMRNIILITYSLFKAAYSVTMNIFRKFLFSF